MTPRLTYAEIGQALGGISRQAVHKLKGRGMPVDSIEAARRWHLANVDPARQAIDAADLNAVRAADGAVASPADGGASDDGAPPGGAEAAAPEDSGLRQARVRQVTAAAEIAELELQERRGDLVSLKGVVLPLMEDLTLKFCAELDNLAPRAAAELAALSDEWQCEQALKAHVLQLRERIRLTYLRAQRVVQGQGNDEDDDDDGS